MPFSNKYLHMGQTERIRVPKILMGHMEEMLEEYNRLYGTRDEDYMNKLTDKIIEGLRSID
jgi:hypothetical protein